jgi:type I restriction enzyme S subunit
LSDVVLNLDSKRRPVTRAVRQPGPYAYYGASGVEDRVAGWYLFDGTFLLVGEDGSVINRDRGPVLDWATGNIWVINRAHVLIARDGQVNLRNLYFFLQTIDISPFISEGTQPKLNQGNMNRIPIAVRPRGGRDRIVAILDGLDALVSDLSAGLSAEVEARRQQYKCSRDRLLTSKERAA